MKALALFFQNLSKSLIAWVKVLFVSKKFRKKAKPDYKGQRVFILGNGPSLNAQLQDEQAFEKLKNEKLVCVNHFCETPYFEKLQPEFYIIAAPELYQKDVDEHLEKKREHFWNELISKTSWEMKFIIPYLAAKNPFWLKKVQENPNIKVEFYNIIPLEGFTGLTHYYYNRQLGLPRVHNIVGYTIMNMIWRGFGDINLLGVEHSWLPQINVDENNIARIGLGHFYDPNKKAEAMYKDGHSFRKLHEILEKLLYTFRGYHEIKEYANKKKSTVYNLTPDSFIDAFERRTFDEAIKD